MCVGGRCGDLLLVGPRRGVQVLALGRHAVHGPRADAGQPIQQRPLGEPVVGVAVIRRDIALVAPEELGP